MTGAYRAYRTTTHRLSLAGVEPLVPIEQFREMRAAVTALWDGTMDDRPAEAQV